MEKKGKLTFVGNRNAVHMDGRIVQDAKLFEAGKSTVARFNVAINRRFKDAATGEYKEHTDFVPCALWNELGKKLEARLKKGTGVQIDGRLASSSWTDKETKEKRFSLEVNVREINIVTIDSKDSVQAEETVGA